MFANQSQVASGARTAVGVQAPFEMVRSQGTILATKRKGAGQLVICLHATGQGGRDFEEFTNAIVPMGYEVICIDWPGHGASPADASGIPANVDRYTALLEDVLNELCGTRRMVLLGNSIGGAVALTYALRHPSKLHALVLCNPSGLAPLDFLAKAVISTMVAFFNHGARRSWWFTAAYGVYYRMVLPERAAKEQRARIIAAGCSVAPVLVQAWDSFRHSAADLREAAKQLKVPVMFAWAKHDRIVAYRRSKQAIDAIVGAEVQMFSGGHSPFLEDPKAFNDAFVEFTQRFKPDQL